MGRTKLPIPEKLKRMASTNAEWVTALIRLLPINAAAEPAVNEREPSTVLLTDDLFFFQHGLSHYSTFLEGRLSSLLFSPTLNGFML